MLNQTQIRDPKLRRLVHDFDALADVLHRLLEKEPRPEREAPSLPHETEFTTEWQMVGAAEEAPVG